MCLQEITGDENNKYTVIRRCQEKWLYHLEKKAKAVPLHAREALGGRGSIAPTHSQPRY